MKRGYWHDVLASGGFTPLPRWSRSDRPEVAEVRRILPAPVADTVLLAAHVKVLAALTGDREVVTGCRTAPGAAPLLVRVPVRNGTWRALTGAAEEVLAAAVRNG